MSTTRSTDKQLAQLKIADLVKKRKLDQALNIKEFARLAGISYSQARDWFRKPGFPAIGSVVFWIDFVLWRQAQCGLTALLDQAKCAAAKSEPVALTWGGSEIEFTGKAAQILEEQGVKDRKFHFSPRAAKILREAGCL
jgi:hypothetical protein